MDDWLQWFFPSLTHRAMRRYQYMDSTQVSAGNLCDQVDCYVTQIDCFIAEALLLSICATSRLVMWFVQSKLIYLGGKVKPQNWTFQQH